MSYMSIDNLYKPKVQRLLEFKKVYALEKIHGTSAHVRWDGAQVGFFSGGEPHKKFVALFDEPKLKALFTEKFGELSKVFVYGEAYGGKQQGMSHTYGPSLKFVAFDVKINDNWLGVPDAHALAESLGFDFVPFHLVDATIDVLNFWRDQPSLQAAKNGIEGPKLREGIVIRPPFECYLNGGSRLIAKHKGEAFSEREKPVHKILDASDPKAIEMLAAEAIAQEWATPMRLEHVIDHIIAAREEKLVGMEDTKAIISEMCADIEKESEPTVTITPRIGKAIGTRTAALLKLRLNKELESKHES